MGTSLWIQGVSLLEFGQRLKLRQGGLAGAEHTIVSARI